MHGFRRVHRPGQDVQRGQRLLRLFGRGDAAVQRSHRQPPQERATPFKQQQRHLRIQQQPDHIPHLFFRPHPMPHPGSLGHRLLPEEGQRRQEQQPRQRVSISVCILF